MLKLDQLDISGFKSFVDPTRIEFSNGITAVVGPNGCGKSNVSDAITWALGEQSAKSMRGDTMEDVIFNGTEGRRPLGLAEVSLSLAAPPGFPGTQDGRLQLSRRVFRSGESQYRLNGKLVRLKDFRDLLMDTGLGLRAYSVIEQGKIGMILSGKPQERRRLLEEAAGVTRYKQRKRIAEVKLEEAHANLLRIHDIIAEIERNLRSLKRQAGAAKRLQEKQEEYAQLLRQVLDRRWLNASKSLGELRTAIGVAQEADAEAVAGLHRDEAALLAEREAVEAAGDDLSQRQRKQAERGAFLEGRQALVQGHRRSLEEARARRLSGEQQALRRGEELATSQRALTDLEARRSVVSAEHDAAHAAVREDEARISAAEVEAERAEQRLEALRAQLLSSLGEVTTLRNQLHREQIESEKGAYRQSQLGEQLTLWSTQIEEAARILTDADHGASGLAERLSTIEQELEGATERSSSLAALIDDLRQRERASQNQLVEARQRQRTLSELSAAQGERRQAWRQALIAAGVPAATFLGDSLRPPAGWERSLDLYFGEIEDAVILDSSRMGLDLAAALSASRIAGRVIVRGPNPDFTEIETEESAARRAITDDPTVVARLADALRLEPALATALPPAYLVESARDAQRLAAQYPGVAFLSRERLWAHGGLLHIEGEQAQPGLFERQREATALGQRVPLLEAQIAELEAGIAARAVEHRKHESRLTTLRAEAVALREGLAAARARRDELAGRHQRLAVELGTLSTERAEIERELGRISERERLVQTDLQRAEQRHRDLEASFDEAQGTVATTRAAREALRTAGAGRRGRLDLLVERLAGLDQEAARARRNSEEAARQEAAWIEDRESLTARAAELEAAIAQSERELQNTLEARAAAEAALHGDAEALDANRARLRQLEHQLQTRRDERDQRRAASEDLRIRQAALQQEAEHLAATYREEFATPPPETATLTLDGDPAEPTHLAEFEFALAQTKDAIEKLGPVNVLAAHEHTEQEERHVFLTGQRADIVQSIDSLKATIQEINQTSSERFRETFREVNEAFGRTFADLFRGGEAEMRLLDEEDVMESGIEIVARPPGKRTQNIMLLSGGEKALTAIALLFALFRTKPSPFCILDEVDAPLDDVNTLRFVEMLEKMAGETQFIVITHNKLTMEVATRLYGVTMEERGVSKLIAVTLGDVQPRQSVEPAPRVAVGKRLPRPDSPSAADLEVKSEAAADPVTV